MAARPDVDNGSPVIDDDLVYALANCNNSRAALPRMKAELARLKEELVDIDAEIIEIDAMKARVV